MLYPLDTCKTKFQAELQTQQAAHKYSVEDREVASCTVASLLCSQIKLSKAYFRRSVHDNRQARLPRSLHWNPLRSGHCENLVLRCTKNLSWEGALPYASAENDVGIIKGIGVVEPIDTEEAPQIPILQSDQDIVEVKNEPSVQLTTFKLPMWLLGPSVLLVTGIVPTLWLPLSSMFLGPNIAGLRSLIGYSYFKRLYLEKSGAKSIGTKANLLVAAAAGACTAIVTQPLDTASSRMQTSAFGHCLDGSYKRVVSVRILRNFSRMIFGSDLSYLLVISVVQQPKLCLFCACCFLIDSKQRSWMHVCLY